MNKDDNYTIIVDTREQYAYEFGYHTTSREKLDTGDYSIKGLEDIVTIERKQSVSEIANNITTPRFTNELERMRPIAHKFLLCEFNLEDIFQFPVGSDIPKRLWEKLRVSNNYILKFLIEKVMLEYEVQVIFAGDSTNGEKIASRILNKIYAKYQEKL